MSILCMYVVRRRRPFYMRDMERSQNEEHEYDGRTQTHSHQKYSNLYYLPAMSQQQQLSLHGFIPDNELRISLHTLGAICGMPPQRMFDHCVNWNPSNPFKPVMGAGQVNQIEQYRITSIADLTKETKEVPKVVGYKEGPEILRKREWTLQINEIPEAGKRKVTSQSILTSKIAEGDPFEFMKQLGYTYSHEYWIRGYMFILGDAILTLFRICIQDTSAEPDEHGFKPLKLLDPSGRWTMKAAINVKQLVDLEGINTASSQLEKLQGDLTGVVDLTMPDRNCLNTRIRTQ